MGSSPIVSTEKLLVRRVESLALFGRIPVKVASEAAERCVIADDDHDRGLKEILGPADGDAEELQMRHRRQDVVTSWISDDPDPMVPQPSAMGRAIRRLWFEEQLRLFAIRRRRRHRFLHRRNKEEF